MTSVIIELYNLLLAVSFHVFSSFQYFLNRQTFLFVLSQVFHNPFHHVRIYYMLQFCAPK